MDTLETMAVKFRSEAEKYFEDRPRHHYPQPLRHLAIEFARQACETKQYSFTRVSKILGISDWSLRFWMAEAGRALPPRQQEMKPVVINHEVQPLSDIRLLLSSGHEVHGLQIEELAQLIAALG